jgi:GNAT superfamily N-acetyltransferase
MPVRELTTEDELLRAFPVMNELRTHLDEKEYLDTVKEMTDKGYRLFALEEDAEIVALAGIGEGVNFYYGKFIWVYDLITSESARSRGHGQELVTHIEKLAEESGCRTVALASALFRKDAHRFYEERMGYTKASYTFSKEL